MSEKMPQNQGYEENADQVVDPGTLSQEKLNNREPSATVLALGEVAIQKVTGGTEQQEERVSFLEQLTERERAIAENLEVQLPTSHTAYQEHMKALGLSTELTLEAYNQLFTETLSDWHTRGILDYLATDLEDNGNEPLLISVPNKLIDVATHRQAAVAFGEGQSAATRIDGSELWSDLAPEQISGPLYGTAELRFRAVPSGYTKALGENTADRQHGILESLQQNPETSQLGLQDVSPLEAVASWYTQRQQRGGGPLVGDDVFSCTHFRHVTLPEKYLVDGDCAQASYIRNDGEMVLGWDWSDRRGGGRASAG